MNAANGNEPLSETAVLVENILDDLLAEAELDNPSGPIDPRDALIEMAARAIARCFGSRIAAERGRRNRAESVCRDHDGGRRAIERAFGAKPAAHQVKGLDTLEQAFPIVI